jgi:RimJ/RimL family protein N-acetyltransferase
VEIRPAVPGDALAIATVHVHSWQAAYRGQLPQGYLDDLTPDGRVGQWRTALDATAWPSTGTLVLVENPVISSEGTAVPASTGTIVGFAGMGPTRDDDEEPAAVGELYTLYLAPPVWRRGGGSLLLEAAQEQFRRARFRDASAWVLETNVGARQFYERRGWRFDGTTKDHDWGTFVVTDVRYRVPLT